jgi:hypothetical protein
MVAKSRSQPKKSRGPSLLSGLRWFEMWSNCTERSPPEKMLEFRFIQMRLVKSIHTCKSEFQPIFDHGKTVGIYLLRYTKFNEETEVIVRN